MELSDNIPIDNYDNTNHLHIENQKKAIHSGCEELYVDISYKNKEIKRFFTMLDKTNEGDVVKISKISVSGPNITDYGRRM